VLAGLTRRIAPALESIAIFDDASLETALATMANPGATTE
jgi:hypothetical protein